MPTKRKTTMAAEAAAAALPPIPKELIDQFVTWPMSAKAVQATSMAFNKALIERAPGAAQSYHRGYPPGATQPQDAGNHRNGSSAKAVLTENGPLRIDVPRDRQGSFEPLLIAKHQRRFTGFDDNIVAMYARGMTARDPGLPARAVRYRGQQGDLPGAGRAARRHARHPGDLDREHRGREVLAQGLQRPEDPRRGRHPDRRHPRAEGHRRRAGCGVPGHDAADVHRASDPQQPGLRQLEGPQAAGRGAQAGLHGAEAAAAALEEFERGPWAQKYPTVVASWRRAWDRVIPFFAFPPAVRRVVYTTNAVESVHSRLRKIIKTHGHFPSDDVATDLVWLALLNIMADWGRAAKQWREAMNQFAIAYGDRFTRPAT
jgi:hypothetical protein